MMAIDKQFKKWLIDVRRDFHMHPETLFQEVRTTEKIMARLSELGIKHHGFEDMTGVVGYIRGREPGKTIALRADIDAFQFRSSMKFHINPVLRAVCMPVATMPIRPSCWV